MTPPTRLDDHPAKTEGPAIHMLSLRGPTARGNPFSFRPQRGRAMLCIAEDADCHVGLRPPRNDNGNRKRFLLIDTVCYRTRPTGSISLHGPLLRQLQLPTGEFQAAVEIGVHADGVGPQLSGPGMRVGISGHHPGAGPGGNRGLRGEARPHRGRHPSGCEREALKKMIDFSSGS